MMGITLSGSSICGAEGHVDGTQDEDICLKWYFLGAISPFSRTWNKKETINPNDPFNFTKDIEYEMKHAMNLKYRLIPYMYTEYHIISVYGGTFFQPIYNEFPTDQQAYW